MSSSPRHYSPIFRLHAFFFFNDTATTEIYTLSLHDALPISARGRARRVARAVGGRPAGRPPTARRSEEHTSELQSHSDLVCRLLLEKKKKTTEYNSFKEFEATELPPARRAASPTRLKNPRTH